MLEQVNNGDQEALKAFLQTYAKHIYERARAKSPNEDIAREATRIAVLNIKQAAQAGSVPPEPTPWIDRMTDESVQRLILPLGTVKKPSAAQSVQAPAPRETVKQEPKPRAEEQRTYTRQTERTNAAPAPQPLPVQRQNAEQNYYRPETAPRQSMNGAPVRQASSAYSASSMPPVQQAQPLRAESAQGRAPRNTAPQTAAPQNAARGAATRSVQEERARGEWNAERRAKSTPSLFDDDRTEFETQDEEAPRKRTKRKEEAPVGMVLLIFLLVLVVLGLIWMLLVMLMSKGYLPMMDFGFASWFNANVFQLF